ncbi:MAG: hypothetical protein MMC33_007181 [Icmadophila ericetorum]|nr:hypothetical protein [Icmadophila ericetorum]
MPPIPITIITGFLGAGKTTLILNLIPQLPPAYRLALLKNEFGDLAVDSQLASSAAISGVRELLNGCICCNLVGQLGDALETLRIDVNPDRIIIETSGSAFPATLALEVNRLARESGQWVLDGVVVVIDVENWKGYEDTSYTAKMQAKYTDLIVLNKWEHVGERRYEECLDRLGDLELQLATVKSDKGKVDYKILLGLDSALAKKLDAEHDLQHSHEEHTHEHKDDHPEEVEVLSITLYSMHDHTLGVDLEALETFLFSCPKDEIYRIKAILSTTSSPPNSDGSSANPSHAAGTLQRYILNWAFSRWTFTPTKMAPEETAVFPRADSPVDEKMREVKNEPILRMTVILAKYESEKWKNKLLKGDLVKPEGEGEGICLEVKRVS